MAHRGIVSYRGRPGRILPGNRRPLWLQRLEERTLLTLAPAAAASELAADASGSALVGSQLVSCPVPTSSGLAALATVENAMADSSPRATAVQASTLLSVPPHHSDSSATAKLFLDFNGHFEANWGDSKNVRTPTFDQDGHPASFTSDELAAIDEIWARVAEDYAPFNIDVTTVDPGSYAHGVVAVIAIGGDSSDWYGDVAGGVAYVGGFAAGSPAPNVGYVFSETLGNEAKLVADAASHEAGHLFGLNHQAVWNGGSLADEYNPGRPDWAPIMGVSYDAVRSTWYNGTPDTLASVHQDDMAMIAGPENGFGYRQDDYGDTFQGAAALPLAASDLSFSGLIGQIDDRDVWAFTTDTALVNFQITGAPFGPNLDGELELWDSSGSLVASSSSSLNSSVSATVASGTYYLVARGAGDYGDVGQYTITGTLVPAAAPEIEVSVNGTALKDSGTLDFGNTTLGQPVVQTITVTNVGNAVLTLVPFNWSQVLGAVTLVSNIGDTSLDPGESTSFTLQLDATTQCALADFIQLTSDDSDEGTFDLQLRGTVNPPNVPEIDVSGDAYFGNTTVGTPVTHTFIVTNLGTAPLILGSLNGMMPWGFTLVNDLGSTLLNSGESTSFALRLDAADVIGAISGEIDLVNNDLDEGLLRLNLSGVVGAPAPQPAPEIDLALDGQSIGDGGTLDFGSTIQRDAVNLTITVTNLGSIRLHLTPLNPASMPSGFSLLSNIDSTSLAPGESTSIMLRFNAATVGFISGAFHLVNSDSDEGSYDVTVSGTAIAPLRQLVDDGDDANLLNGLWRRPTGSGYERDTHYSARGNGSKFSTWYFNVPSGQYRVYATWTWNKHNASNAPFTLLEDFRPVGFARVNQRVAPGPQSSIGRWRLLGTVTLINGGLTVKLTNAANGYVIADAVRVEQAGGYRSPPEILMTLAPTANAVALGQPQANASQLVSSSAVLLPPPTATSNAPGQSTSAAVPPRPASVQATRSAEPGNPKAVDGIITRLAMSDSHSLISSVDLIVSGERDEAS